MTFFHWEGLSISEKHIGPTWHMGDGSCIPLQVPVPRGRGLGDASCRDGPDKDVTQCGSRINIAWDFDQQHDQHDDATSFSFMAGDSATEKIIVLSYSKSTWVKN